MSLPPPATERLLIRPLTLADLDAVYELLDVEQGQAEAGRQPPHRAAREQWLRWTVLSYEQLAQLHQPPYGERAVVLRQSGRLIGAVGYVPCLAPFGQIAALRPAGSAPTRLHSTELGLFYALAPAERRRGYASEAADALIRYAFRELRLARIVATTSYGNAASIGVMRKLGMRVAHNPYPEPPWMEIVGVLDNPDQAEPDRR